MYVIYIFVVKSRKRKDTAMRMMKKDRAACPSVSPLIKGI